MGKHIEPAPDISDERLVELIRWTGKAGMPDVHALLLDLQQRRAAQTAGAERVSAVVRPIAMTGVIEAIDRMMGPTYWFDNPGAHGTFKRVADAIADRIAAQLTAPPPGHVCPVPYALSPEDLDTLSELQSLAELSDWPRARAVLAQILAAHRAPGPRS